MTNKLGFWLAHLFVLAYLAVLLMAFGVQFVAGEFPCPLCMLQRMAMILACVGPIYIISRARHGEVSIGDFAFGYGLSIVAAVAGAAMSARQVLLHILPGDPGYGSPVLGLHLYTWAFITFTVVIVFSAVMVIFADRLRPKTSKGGLLSKLLIWVFLAMLVAQIVTVFALEGLHWVLPDNPDGYRLFDRIGLFELPAESLDRVDRFLSGQDATVPEAVGSDEFGVRPCFGQRLAPFDRVGAVPGVVQYHGG